MENDLNLFFYPESICIIGASSKPKSLGYELTKSVKQYGYKGKVFIVNPKSEEILGFKCNSTLNEIEEKIDLAIIMVQKQLVIETLEKLIERNVKSVILITAGFKETGDAGADEEQKILALIKRSSVRMVGPNCMGIINSQPTIKLNATFVAEEPETGKMAFCSQSGAIGAAVLNSLRETNIRFSHFISVGNKADVNENDLLEYWEKCSDVGVLTFYLESFVDGEKFIKNFADAKIRKPVIVLKGGRTSSGMKAASSHTGALGSSDKVVDSVLHQLGIIRADNLNDMFNTAKGFEEFSTPEGNRIAVVTNAGGPAILTVDSLEKNNLTLAELSDQTKTKLMEIVHPAGSVNNPVDLLPGGIAEQYKAVNEILINDENVDAVISIFVEPVMVSALPVIESINDIDSAKPIFQVVMPLPEFWNIYIKESKTKRSLFRNPEEPAVVIGNLLKFKKGREEKVRLSQNHLKGNSLIDSIEKGKILNQEFAERLCADYNIPIIKQEVFSLDELKDKDFDYPLAVKAVGEKIIHKSELDAVKLNIRNKEELLAICKVMSENFTSMNVELDSFLIQPFISAKFELLVGAFRDPSFGAMVMFGSGGKYVEYLDDTVMRSAYLSDDDIDEMIESTKIGRILKGVRGEKPADIEAAKSVIRNLAQMMLDNEEISEVDFNPLIVTTDNKLLAVDVRIGS